MGSLRRAGSHPGCAQARRLQSISRTTNLAGLKAEALVDRNPGRRCEALGSGDGRSFREAIGIAGTSRVGAMYVLARLSRQVPFVLVSALWIAIPIGAIATARPPAVTVTAFAAAFLLLAVGVLIRGWSRRQQLLAVLAASKADRAFGARLTRRSYTAMQVPIRASGAFYEAAMRVWVTVTGDSMSIYCTTMRVGGRAVLLADQLRFHGALPSSASRRRVVLSSRDFGVLDLIVSKGRARVLRGVRPASDS